MAKKAERTKNRIIQIASLIFHEKGYANTSMSDILSATGLSKGGIYGNFNSKEEIALEAFKYNTRLLFERGKQLINNNKLTSIEKLYSLLKLHYKSLNDPRLTGRCPVLNTAVEAHQISPELNAKVAEVMDQWLKSLEKIMREGMKKQEIKDNINPEYYAGLFISLIEGGILLSNVRRNPLYMENNMKEIKRIIIRDLVKS